jgi:hypothetical protein
VQASIPRSVSGMPLRLRPTEIVGDYGDASGRAHGFIRWSKPPDQFPL